MLKALKIFFPAKTFQKLQTYIQVPSQRIHLGVHRYLKHNISVTNFSISFPASTCFSFSISIRTWCHHSLNCSSPKLQISCLIAFFSLSQHSIHLVGLKFKIYSPNWPLLIISIITTIVPVSTGSYLYYCSRCCFPAFPLCSFHLFLTKQLEWTLWKTNQTRSVFHKKPSKDFPSYFDSNSRSLTLNQCFIFGPLANSSILPTKLSISLTLI